MTKQNKVPLQVLLQILLCIALVFVGFGSFFRSNGVFGLSNSPQRVDSIKTAMAGTMQALLGPFPTSTAPTKTASSTPTPTLLISATPTFTPSKTFTPVPSRTKLGGTATLPVHNSLTKIVTATKFPTRTLVPTKTATRIPTRTLVPTRTLIPSRTATVVKTRTPTLGPSRTPVPPTKTRVPPTRTPRPPTRTPRPPTITPCTTLYC